MFFCIAIHVHATENIATIYCATRCHNVNISDCDNTIGAHAWSGLVGLYFCMHGVVGLQITNNLEQ